MKNTIPSDVWERKKALIAKLYKDEEWPLKQVIKQIRSDDFNPSETQLRSRLKKWRVTKPSRQTRKKSQDNQQDVNGDSSSHEAGSPKDEIPISPKTQLYSTQKEATVLSSSEPDFYMGDGVYVHHDFPTTGSFNHQDASNTWAHDRDSSVLVISNSNSFEPSSHTSPLADGVLLDSTSPMASSFQNSHYAVTTGSCMTTPTTAATAPISWVVPQWYPIHLEAGAHPPSMPYYTAPPLSPPIDPAMQMVSPHPPHRLYSPPSPGCSFSHEQAFDPHDPRTPSLRTMPVPYSPGTAGGHLRANQRGGQQEKKMSLPTKLSNHSSVGPVTHAPIFPSGHPVMCAPTFPY
ncbi:hypothetical protein F9C07_2169535 [Aspergillus flavus]|uniref:Clr5 domain-containing protein n=5 Tax=Aspergillus subgen. Circumdati TaxID=2720871 RepID=A0A7U2N246_ASPFN|nr:uncharacterized protein G4B84_009588 [Aspergillus flavus NRRL3357]EIT77374.1 hypothetical protein Ao3042_06435 [Aspergillus oryzae 3.042]KAB8244033.1 hypothetical protein BDV35DRAFT_361211 [Aspergillus flavus]KDE82379.1 hypothetical protein AO1008_08782 [Aspergillus oryzae 100-8]OOO08920.1 Clr5 domain [Aspergillus oryzae]GMG54512.1 unnamed protein product [Aspergillus oryzae var. brunneus]|eukprot:EIT77374.1 hypothetical protein Ao3042_06435 [Aspergillus oryzae 3.042]